MKVGEVGSEGPPLARAGSLRGGETTGWRPCCAAGLEIGRGGESERPPPVGSGDQSVHNLVNGHVPPKLVLTHGQPSPDVTELDLEARGPDAEEALAALAELVAAGFHMDEEAG